MKILLLIWQSLRRRKGFTIIELLVASTILVILFSSITAVFLAANRAWTQSEARAQIHQNAREALSQMSREIATAFPSSTVGPLDGGSHIPLKLDNLSYTVDSTSFDKDQLTLVAAYNFAPVSGEYDLTHLGYRLNTADLDDIKLQRYKKDFCSTYDGSTLDSNAWKEMALYIISLNFRCHDSSSWNDIWTSPALPEAVEITIQVQDKQKRYEPMTFQNVVYLSTSQ